MSSQQDREILNALGAILSDAAALTRRLQPQRESLGAHQKADKSPVTVADFAAQALITQRLQALEVAPLRLVGEESGGALRESSELAVQVAEACLPFWKSATPESVIAALDAGGDPGRGGRYWSLDPVDGTKGFLRGQQFAISLALLEEGEVRLGALACPRLAPSLEASLEEPAAEGTLYLAARGGGCQQLTLDAAGAAGVSHPISAERGYQKGIVRLCESVEAAHSAHGEAAEVLAALGGEARSVRLDSQAKYATVARGQADLYLRLPTRPGYVERIWDHAAGMLVAEEAGAVVTDITGKALDFRHGWGLEKNRGVVCAHPALHRAVIEAIGA